MATVYDGHGAVLTFNGTAMDCVSIVLGGWTRATYETTKLTNTAVKTKRGAALAEIGDITATVEYDPTKINALRQTLGGTSYACTIVKSPGMNFSCYGEVTAIGDVTLDEDNRATVDITITVTCNNNGAEAVQTLA